MARAGLNRKSALATLTLVLAAEAPDIDMLANLRSPLAGFAHHRGFTHTFLGVPLVAALVLLVVFVGYRWWGRRHRQSDQPMPRWGILFGLACLSGFSHILLDFITAYGVRPFEPFSYRWFSWDIVSIVEPVLWVILAGGLILPALLGLIAEEVSTRRQRDPRGRTGALVALALVAALWGFRDFQHRHAIAAMQALTWHGEDPNRVSAFPYALNPFQWYGVVETRNGYHSVIVNSWIPEVDPEDRAIQRYKPEETPELQAAKKSYAGQVFLDWARCPITETERVEGPPGYLVHFYDVRYAYPDRKRGNSLTVWVRLDAKLRVIEQTFGKRPE